MGSKSRLCYGTGCTKEQYEEIFGHSGPKIKDEERGQAKKDVPIHSDFGVYNTVKHTLKDLHRYKDPKDRAKITKEYFGLEKEYRTNRVIGKVDVKL
jgi:hypothetical protein